MVRSFRVLFSLAAAVVFISACGKKSSNVSSLTGSSSFSESESENVPGPRNAEEAMERASQNGEQGRAIAAAKRARIGEMLKCMDEAREEFLRLSGAERSGNLLSSALEVCRQMLDAD